MESTSPKWRFRPNEDLQTAPDVTIKGVLTMLMQNLNKDDPRPVIPLGHGDPSAFPCFRTASVAEEAVAESVRCGKFNGYAPSAGISSARRAIADYLSKDLPSKLCPDDVYVTVGGRQAIETILKILTRPNSNILLPRPGYPYYEAVAGSCHLEVRHFDLIPERGWEVDLDAVESLADENSIGMAFINPGNPCGNVYSSQHLKKIAETARKLGLLVIADEVYNHLAFGNNPFVPMAVYASIAPVITIGSISKRWLVPGWRLGWLVTNDPNGILKEYGILDCIKGVLNMSPDPPTFIQGAVSQILGKTQDDFFVKTLNTLREAANICYDGLKDISCITCTNKPEGGMFLLVKLNPLLMEDITDDLDFCVKLAKEENLIILPGITLGIKNWLRITIAVEPSSLEDGIGRLKGFCKMHSKIK